MGVGFRCEGCNRNGWATRRRTQKCSACDPLLRPIPRLGEATMMLGGHLSISLALIAKRPVWIRRHRAGARIAFVGFLPGSRLRSGQRDLSAPAVLASRRYPQTRHHRQLPRPPLPHPLVGPRYLNCRGEIFFRNRSFLPPCGSSAWESPEPRKNRTHRPLGVPVWPIRGRLLLHVATRLKETPCDNFSNGD